MTPEQRQQLRAAALRANRSVGVNAIFPWELQTSNSFRRIGAKGDGDVLCATTHPIDHHPDLLAPPGVLDYIIAAQPRVVLELLDHLDAADALSKQLDDVEARLAHTQEILTVLVRGAEQLMKNVSTMTDVRAAFDVFSKLLDGLNGGAR